MLVVSLVAVCLGVSSQLLRTKTWPAPSAAWDIWSILIDHSEN